MILGARINGENGLLWSLTLFKIYGYWDVARRRRRKIWVRTGIWENLESRTEPPLGVGGCPQILKYLSKITRFFKYLSPMITPEIIIVKQMNDDFGLKTRINKMVPDSMKSYSF